MLLPVHAKVLLRAAEILGGTNALREHLRVPASHLRLWLSGAEKPPLDVYMRAIEVVRRHTDFAAHDPVESSRELREQARLLRAAVTRTRERAAEIQASVVATRAERRAQGGARSPVTFLNAHFAASEGRNLVEAAMDAALGAACTERGTLHLRCVEGVCLVAQRGFDDPFLD